MEKAITHFKDIEELTKDNDVIVRIEIEIEVEEEGDE